MNYKLVIDGMDFVGFNFESQEFTIHLTNMNQINKARQTMQRMADPLLRENFISRESTNVVY